MILAMSDTGPPMLLFVTYTLLLAVRGGLSAQRSVADAVTVRQKNNWTFLNIMH